MITYPLVEKAKKLLFEQYEENLNIVRSSAYHTAYVKEKIRHSLQVFGAGNGILANEPYFKNKPQNFIDICKTAILLHDIYRFKEVRMLFETGEKTDHGVEGAKFLSQTADFNNILMTLPIKHHGHMIEELYQDEVFQNLDAATKDQVKHICFAVRDADKIANWQMVTHEFESVKDVWLAFPDDTSESQGFINDSLWSYFTKCEIAPKDLRQTNAEVIVSIMCWLFDINYPYSIFYAQKLDLFERLCLLLKELKVDEEKIKQAGQIMKNYVSKKFQTTI